MAMIETRAASAARTEWPAVWMSLAGKTLRFWK
jgi:hypothetical protein